MSAKGWCQHTFGVTIAMVVIGMAPASVLAQSSGGAMSSAHADQVMAVLEAGRPKMVHCEPLAQSGDDDHDWLPSATQSGTKTVVEARVSIEADGSVQDAKITESDGSRALDRCIRTEILTWQFPSYTKTVKVLTRWYF